MEAKRELKFRGKRKDTGDWCYGYGIIDNYNEKECSIFITHDSSNKLNYVFVEVFSETVGQYAGLPDEKGKDIYAGDIVRYVHYKREYVEEVIFEDCCFTPLAGFNTSGDYEIIGNKYDNPELLEM